MDTQGACPGTLSSLQVWAKHAIPNDICAWPETRRALLYDNVEDRESVSGRAGRWTNIAAWLGGKGACAYSNIRAELSQLPGFNSVMRCLGFSSSPDYTEVGCASGLNTIIFKSDW